MLAQLPDDRYMISVGRTRRARLISNTANELSTCVAGFGAIGRDLLLRVLSIALTCC
jgi:hypothetical protein